MKNAKRTKDNNVPVEEQDNHPIGAGLGGAAGAASGAILGAQAGIPGGPAGIAAGAIVGGAAGLVLGTKGGQGYAEFVNPTEIDSYWKENYSSRPYASNEYSYETYQPAYQAGYKARVQNPNKKFEDIESTLSSDWNNNRGNSKLEWKQAREAARDSYEYTDTLYRQKTNK